jgi:leucyl/phenylalanyl-tRNA--protein transferase
MPSPDLADEAGFVAAGADLEVSTLLDAYRAGLFPMPVRRNVVGWWSPDPRGVIPLDGLVVSRSLAQSCRRMRVTVDRSFTDVMRACGDPSRPHGWINRSFIEQYSALHRLGHAHSIEVRDAAGTLIGGLYGVRIGRFFAGESMFHVVRDASKVALVALVEAMRVGGLMLLDVQWTTPHLVSLGAVDISRERYLALLADAVS